MYCAHFGLQRPPFNNTPDPAFYYGTSEHEEALATLEYATTQRKGFVLVTGEIGAGKTLIGRMFLRRVEPRARTAIITHTHLNGRQLLAAICSEFELVVPPEASNLQLAEILQTFLLEQYAQDRYVVVLLDEAQNLPDESFEAVRMLGNLEADDAKLLSICILGQPELRERFSQPNMRQLDQRLFRRFHLSTLSREQTAAYIAHRLKVAGWNGKELFTPAAIDRIQTCARGTPRVINRICDNALLTVYGRHGALVDADVIDEVAGTAAPVLQPTQPGEAGLHKGPRLPARPAIPARTAPANASEKANHIAKAQAELHARAVSQVSVRLDANEQELRSLGREVARQIQTLSAGLTGLEGKAASSEELDRVRGECMDSVQEVLKGLESQAAALNELRAEIDRVLTAAAGGQQAPLDYLSERFERQVRELQLLYREVTASRSSAEDRLDALTVRIIHNDEQIGRLDARLNDQMRSLGDLEHKMLGELEAVERNINSLFESSATRDELALTCGEQKEALRTLRDEQAEVTALVHKQEDAIGALMERQQAAVADMIERQAAMLITLNEEQSATLEQLRQDKGFSAEFFRSQQQAALEALHREQQAAMAALTSEQAAALEELRKEAGADTQRLQQQQQALAAALTEEQQSALAALKAQQVEALERLQHAQVETQDALGRQRALLENVSAEVNRHDGTIDALGRQLEERLGALSAELEQWRAGTARAEDVEQWRREQDAALSQLLNQVQAESEALTRLQQAVAAQAEALSGERRRAVEESRRHIARQARRLGDLRHRFEAWRNTIAERLDGLTGQVSADGRAIQDLGERLGERERQLQALDERVAARFAQIDGALRSGLDQAATRDELSQLRDLNLSALADLVKQLGAESKAIRQLKERVNAEAAAASQDNRRLYEELSKRIGRQARRMRAVRQRIVEGQKRLDQQLQGLDERFADRQQFETLKQTTAADASEVRQRIDLHRRDMEALIDGVVQRCREVQEQIDAVSLAKADAADVDRLTRTQAQDATDLLKRLEAHKETVRGQLQMILDQWQRMQGELTRLGTTAAPASELADLRARQELDTRQMFEALAGQRSELEALLAGVNRRCDEISERLQALPGEVADARQVDALRLEHAEQLRLVCDRIDLNRSEFERALGELSEQCSQLEKSIEALMSRMASAEDVELLREAHERDLNEIVGRLDREGTAHQQNVSQMSQRWEELARSLRSLAATVPSTGTLEQLEEATQANLTALHQRLASLQTREREQYQALGGLLQQLSVRLAALEEKERPRPVMIELQPQAGRELAELNERARAEREQLATALEKLENARETMEQTSRRVEESFSRWNEGAAGVEARAQQLRTSAGSAADLLRAMQKAHKILDAKINSQSWREELARGEALTGRLETVIKEGAAVCVRLHAALRDFDRCREEAELWSTRREEAQELTRRLAALLNKTVKAGERFEAELDHRKQVLAKLARNTASLAGVIEEARREDEQAGARARKALVESAPADRVEWPRLHTQAARLAARQPVLHTTV